MVSARARPPRADARRRSPDPARAGTRADFRGRANRSRTATPSNGAWASIRCMRRSTRSARPSSAPALPCRIRCAPELRVTTCSTSRWARVVAESFANDRLTFLYDFPASQAALAQIRGEVASRFEAFWGPLELANGFHELGSAPEQAARFDADLARAPRTRASPSAHVDHRFLDALASRPAALRRRGARLRPSRDGRDAARTASTTWSRFPTSAPERARVRPARSPATMHALNDDVRPSPSRRCTKNSSRACAGCSRASRT